jgi:hypothetical protein
MGKYWFKVGNDLIKDEKVGPLPDNIWRRMIECFNMASILDPDNNGGGELPDLKTMCWFTRQAPETLTKELQILMETKRKPGDPGIIGQKPDGTYFVTNWAKRQGPIDSADRKRMQRLQEQTTDVTNLSRQRDQEVQILTTTTINNNSSSSSKPVTNLSRQRDANVTEVLSDLGIRNVKTTFNSAPVLCRKYTPSEILSDHDPDGAILANLIGWSEAKGAGVNIKHKPALIWVKVVEGEAPPEVEEQINWET